MPRADLSSKLRPSGLVLRGAFAPVPEDGLPELADGSPARAVVLVGNVGPAMWACFEQSPEAADGAPDPLDRWSARVIGALAAQVGATALFPFTGPPWWPFQSWARRAEPVAPSPLGILIHPDYGLWHAYRGALLCGEPPVQAWPVRDDRPSPCLTCAAKPCLTACPVGAVTAQAYDVAACTRHVTAPAGAACTQTGCLARHACPVGTAFRYPPAQAAHHMRGVLALLDRSA